MDALESSIAAHGLLTSFGYILVVRSEGKVLNDVHVKHGECTFVVVDGVHRMKAVWSFWDVKSWTWSPFIHVLVFELQDGSPADYNSQIIALSQKFNCILPTKFPLYPKDEVVAFRSFLCMHNFYGSDQNNSVPFSFRGNQCGI